MKTQINSYNFQVETLNWSIGKVLPDSISNIQLLISRLIHAP